MQQQLIAGIRNNNIIVIKEAIAQGANINHPYPNGVFPLQHAATLGHTLALACLWEEKADTSVAYKYGETPLHIIVSKESGTLASKIEMIEFLIETSPQFLAAKNSRGESPLDKVFAKMIRHHKSDEKGQYSHEDEEEINNFAKIAVILIENGAQPNYEKFPDGLAAKFKETFDAAIPKSDLKNSSGFFSRGIPAAVVEAPIPAFPRSSLSPSPDS